MINWLKGLFIPCPESAPRFSTVRNLIRLDSGQMECIGTYVQPLYRWSSRNWVFRHGERFFTCSDIHLFESISKRELSEIFSQRGKLFVPYNELFADCLVRELEEIERHTPTTRGRPSRGQRAKKRRVGR